MIDHAATGQPQHLRPLDPRTAPGSLAGLRTKIMLLLSAAIRGAHLDRYDVAARMSRFLAEDVPKTMLDAYSAESRLDHNIPAYRFLAFMAATECYPDVNRMLRRLGCVILVGDDAELAAIAEVEVERKRSMAHPHHEEDRAGAPPWLSAPSPQPGSRR